MKKALFAMVALAMATSAVAATLIPVNSKASPKAKAIYAYLQNIKGQGILSGQESMLWDSPSAGNWTYTGASPYSFRDRYVARKNGGKFPAIYESDFGDIGANALPDRQRIVDILKARAPKGTIFMLNWHTGNANAVDGDGYSGAKNTTNAAAIIDKMLTPGDAMNTTWLARLDVIAGYLKQLRDSNIVVLWRPFHENNGNFFWWGQQKRFVELWRQMYDRFTRYHNLDNLLWVYNANHFASSGTDANWVRKNYPGDSLVDVMAVDVYAPYFSFQKHMYDTLMAIGGGKPVGVSENGLMPDVPKLFSEGQHYAFWVTWWGFEDAGDQDGLTGNADAMYTTNYGSPYTITEDEIKLDIVSDGKKTVGVTSSVGGTVKAVPAGRVDSGATVTITATAEAGYDFAGWAGDTSAAASVNPLVVKVVKDRSIQAKFVPNSTINLIKGGAFAGTDSANWNFYAATGNTASVKYGTGSAVATVGVASDLNYEIQLSQNNITIDSGSTYILSFEASSTVARELNAGLSTAGVWYYRGGGTVNLTTTKTPFSIEIPVDSSTDVAVLQFNLGGEVGTTTIDNVTLVRKVSTSIHPRSIGYSKLSLRSVANGFEWTRTAPLASSTIVRVVDTKGRELHRSTAKAGSVSGFVPSVGTGLRFVVLENPAERDIRSLTSAR